MIDQPVIRLTSVDLQASTDVSSIAEVFDFPRDYLGLLKAGVIASGIVPPGIEGATQPLAALLERLTGRPGYGIEIVSQRERHPQRLAARCLHQPAGLHHRCLHACNRPDSFAHWRHGGTRPPAGCRTRHSG